MHADQITLQDIAEEYRDIAETIGMEAFRQLSLLCGGQSLYIPKFDSILRGSRDRMIHDSFTGNNSRALARAYNLSERQIRRILRETGALT